MDEALAAFKVDETDLSILKALNEGCTEPNIRRVQRATGLHRQTIYNRLRKMQEAGIIKKYSPRIDRSTLGLHTQSLVFYELDLPLAHQVGLERIRQALMESPHILQAYSLVPTSDYFVVTHEAYENQHHQQEALLELYRKYPDIMKIVKKRLVFTIDPEDESRRKRFDLSSLLSLIALRKKLVHDAPIGVRQRLNRMARVARAT